MSDLEESGGYRFEVEEIDSFEDFGLSQNVTKRFICMTRNI